MPPVNVVTFFREARPRISRLCFEVLGGGLGGSHRLDELLDAFDTKGLHRALGSLRAGQSLSVKWPSDEIQGHFDSRGPTSRCRAVIARPEAG
jgi:hypothetical protein